MLSRGGSVLPKNTVFFAEAAHAIVIRQTPRRRARLANRDDELNMSSLPSCVRQLVSCDDFLKVSTRQPRQQSLVFVQLLRSTKRRNLSSTDSTCARVL